MGGGRGREGGSGMGKGSIDPKGLSDGKSLGLERGVLESEYMRMRMRMRRKGGVWCLFLGEESLGFGRWSGGWVVICCCIICRFWTKMYF